MSWMPQWTTQEVLANRYDPTRLDLRTGKERSQYSTLARFWRCSVILAYHSMSEILQNLDALAGRVCFAFVPVNSRHLGDNCLCHTTVINQLSVARKLKTYGVLVLQRRQSHHVGFTSLRSTCHYNSISSNWSCCRVRTDYRPWWFPAKQTIDRFAPVWPLIH